MRPVVSSGVTIGAGALGVGYWRHMSPYSQALGTFPYRRAPGSVERSKTVALTFDDGPNEPYTGQVAEILAERDIRATFFQVGRCVQRHPEVTRALAAAGHVIGNHSYAHRFDRGWSAQAQRTEVDLAQQVFTEHLGRQPALYRPPWLIRTRRTFELLRARGLSPVSGEFCHPLEPWQPSPQRIARHALARLGPGGVVIFHDGYNSSGGARHHTVEAVRIVVDTLVARGYDFVTVAELLGLPAYVG